MGQISASASTTLSAFFVSQNDAQNAAYRLVEAGITSDSVRLLPGSGSYTPVTDRSEQHRGFFASLADFFIPNEDRYSYAEGLSRGGYLVAVDDLSATHYDPAVDILDYEGLIDLDEQEESWRSEGWSSYDASATEAYTLGVHAPEADLSAAGHNTTRLLDTIEGEVTPVVNERLVVGKRDVNVCRAHVRSYVREECVSVGVDLNGERITTERCPIDRALSDADVAFRYRTIEAEEYGEVAVIGKEARVTEEISLRNDGSDRNETISDTVRESKIEIEDDHTPSESERLNGR